MTTLEVLLLTSQVVLAVVFAVAAFGKLTDQVGARDAFVEFGAPRPADDG